MQTYLEGEPSLGAEGRPWACPLPRVILGVCVSVSRLHRGYQQRLQHPGGQSPRCSLTSLHTESYPQGTQGPRSSGRLQ